MTVADDLLGPQIYTGGDIERYEEFDRYAGRDEPQQVMVTSLEHGFDEDEWADILEKGE